MTDHAWVAIQRAVMDGLRDYDVLGHPPQDGQELDSLADTITDHVYGAVSQASRHVLARAEQPEPPRGAPAGLRGLFRRT